MDITLLREKDDEKGKALGTKTTKKKEGDYPITSFGPKGYEVS